MLAKRRAPHPHRALFDEAVVEEGSGSRDGLGGEYAVGEDTTRTPDTPLLGELEDEQGQRHVDSGTLGV